MDADLDTLATALYVRADDLLKASPQHAPWRPAIGFEPQITDAEMITLAVMQALLQIRSETRWLRYAHAHLRPLFPYLPQQSGYNKRLRALAATLEWMITALACDTSLWTDDVWVVDSTPVECGRSRETAQRSDLAGYAEYGYCASHSRYFWGLRLHLIATLHGLPVGFALTGAKADEREVLLSILTTDCPATRSWGQAGHDQILIGDKNYFGRMFETCCTSPTSTCCARPARASSSVQGRGCSSRCARQSSRSSTPSKTNSTSKATADTPSPALPCASTSESSPSPPRSGTTTTPANPSNGHYSPTTTDRHDPLESVI